MVGCTISKLKIKYYSLVVDMHLFVKDDLAYLWASNFVNRNEEERVLT